MTKEPLPTTHKVERGARSMCREEPETGPSLEASEHQRDCSGIYLRRSLHVIFKMVYMKENRLESKHGENSSEKH